MQVQKENVRNEILQVSKEEFLNLGFKDTSMRTIAKKVGISVSNIYNYFKNKDEIFVYILKPITSEIEESFSKQNTDERMQLDYFTDKVRGKKMIDIFITFINKWEVELRLLLFRSSGSSMENYKNQWVDKHTEISLEYFRLMKLKYPGPDINISDFFLRIDGAFFINVVGEILMHNLPEHKIRIFANEYLTYSAHGWKALIGI